MSCMRIVNDIDSKPCMIRVYLDGVELRNISYLHPVSIDNREVTITFRPSELVVEYGNGVSEKIF